MTVSFFVNHLNHHQAAVSDELYKRLGDSFRFIETCPPNQQSKKGSSVDFSSRNYLVQAWRSENDKNLSRSLALSSEVAVFGAQSQEYELLRIRETDSLSFEISERWLKRGLINVFSPRFLKSQWYYHTLYYKKPLYKLCAGAFCASDQYLFRSFIGKCYKWGYFIEGAKASFSKDRILDDGPFRLMWCSRFLELKHPELAIQLAKRLKRRGVNFQLDMFGDGPVFQRINKVVTDEELQDVIHLYGAIPNEKVIAEMMKHQIFLFTSDRNEGWGAVVNEAMSCGCAVIASDKIGSVPFLIKQHETGCIFKNKSITSLEEEVLWLISSDNRLYDIQKRSYDYYNRFWTPSNAADSFLSLVQSLKQGDDSLIIDGPCSKAFPI